MSDEVIDQDEDMPGDAWMRRFVRDIDRRYVSDGCVDRATKLIGGIAGLASQHGFSIVAPSEPLLARTRAAKWPWPHIVIRNGEGFLLSFHLSELSKPGTAPKSRTLAGTPKGDAPLWIEERSREFEPTGVMSLRVDGDMPHSRQRSMRDTANSLMDERLPALFDSLSAEARGCLARAEEDRRREMTVDQAQRACRGERMYTALCEEVRLHDVLQSQRVYLDLVEQRLRRTDPEELRQASGDIASMRRRIDARDPLLSGGTAWMDQPEPSDVDVYEYMHRDRRPAMSGRVRRDPDRARRPPRHDAPSMGNGGFFD